MHNDNRDFYDKNGYVILEKIFSDEEAEFFNKCIRRHANKSFAALINPDRYESLLEQDERPKSDITLEEIEETSALARSIMTDKRMVSLLDTFHGSKTIGLSSQFIFKEAYSDYSSQAWRPHQDNFYPKNKNAAYITLNWYVILIGNCIHGSYPNNSSRSRPWFSSCYISEGEDFYIGKSSQREKIDLHQDN